MFLSQARIVALNQEYQGLFMSLKKEKEEGTQKGGPMDSFKEAAATAVNMAAKDEKVAELRRILEDARELPEYIEGEQILLGKWFVLRGPSGSKRYRLVDPLEAEPKDGLVSELSPLGQAVMHQKIGLKFKLNNLDFEIVNIE